MLEKKKKKLFYHRIVTADKKGFIATNINAEKHMLNQANRPNQRQRQISII